MEDRSKDLAFTCGPSRVLEVSVRFHPLQTPSIFYVMIKYVFLIDGYTVTTPGLDRPR